MYRHAPISRGQIGPHSTRTKVCTGLEKPIQSLGKRYREYRRGMFCDGTWWVVCSPMSAQWSSGGQVQYPALVLYPIPILR